MKAQQVYMLFQSQVVHSEEPARTWHD